MIQVTTTMNATKLDAALERIARAGMTAKIEAEQNGTVKSLTISDMEGTERIELRTPYGGFEIRATELDKKTVFLVEFDEKSLTGRRLMRAEASTRHTLQCEQTSEADEWARKFVKDICPEETAERPYKVTQRLGELTALGWRELSSEEVLAVKNNEPDYPF